MKLTKPFITKIVLGMVVVIGVGLRFAAATRGHNFDFDSYQIVTGITRHGGNVYADTTRYNYGPIWFNILHVFGAIAGYFRDPVLVLRGEIVSFLTAVDLGIALVLRRYFGNKAFVLFFLNPVSIVISGYHNQFDNFAILVGLLSAHFFLRYEGQRKLRINRDLVYSLLLLGVSLSIKHIFFLFPIWLAVRARGFWHKVLCLAVPYSFFALAFVPYIGGGGAHGIVANVFKYKSFANAPFYHYVLPDFISYITRPTLLFLIGLLIIGVLVRSWKNPVSLALLYTLCLVLLSPAIANQYLAIPMAAIAAFDSYWYLPYVVFASFWLWSISNEGLHFALQHHELLHKIVWVLAYEGYNWIIAMLAVGMLGHLIIKRSTYGKALKLVTEEWRWQLKQLSQR